MRSTRAGWKSLPTTSVAAGASSSDSRGGRFVLQAEAAGGQDELVEEREVLGVGVGAGEAEQLDPRRAEHLLHRRRARPGDHEDRVDRAGRAAPGRPRCRSEGSRRGGLGDAIGGEQREGDRARAAALRADRQSPAFELAQVGRPGRGAREDPQRLEVQAGQRDQGVGLRARSPVPPCTKAMSTPLLGSSSSRMFSTEPEVSRTSSVMPSRASRSRYCCAYR